LSAITGRSGSMAVRYEMNMFLQQRQTRSQMGELLMKVCTICASNGKIFWQYCTAGLV
jgi:hypothetical protein